MAEENVFRFISVRAPEGSVDGQTRLGLPAAAGRGGGLRGDSRTRTRAQWRVAADQARAEGAIPTGLPGFPLDLSPLVRWLGEHPQEPLTVERVGAAVAESMDSSPSALVGQDAFEQTERALGDALIVHTVAPAGGRPDAIVMGVRAAALVRAAATGKMPAGLTTIGDYLSRTVVLLPEFEMAQDPPTGQYRSLNAGADQADVDDAATRLARLKEAHAELVSAVRHAAAAPVEQPVDPAAGMASPGTDPTVALRHLQTVAGAGPIRAAAAKLRLPAEHESGLSERTRQTLAETGIARAEHDPVAAVGHLETAMHDVAAQASAQAGMQTRMLRIGGVEMSLGALNDAMGWAHGGVSALLPNIQQCQAAAGVGDLLIVRQKIKAYEVGDFAHVENVLAGESRLREHRRLNRTEETETFESEKETEKERDLQSTERNELQTEANKTVQSQMSLDAGLQISGSYGPAVSFSSNLNVGFSTSTTESQRKAATFSREVTEKSAERVKERVRQERVRKVIEEVEEINKHGIDNPAGNGHVRGVYRWLNKIYEAQVFSYGQRMMFDFVVPEPAAFWLYAQTTTAVQPGAIAQPPAPIAYGRPLQANDITVGNYLEWAARYQVTSVPAPPPQYLTTTYFDRQDGTTKNNMGRAGKIEIPAGYKALHATIHTAYVWIEGDNNSFHVTMGGTYLDRTNVWGAVSTSLSAQKEVTIAYTLLQSVAFAIGVDVLCELTNEGWLKWQQSVYDVVIEAYQRQKAAFDEQQRVAAITQTSPVKGDNPLSNVRTVRDELKKWVLMLMIGKTDIGLDGFRKGDKPVLDLSDACENGSYIRFFENCFEWQNMLWVFYPYFWGREARWAMALHFKDADPDWAAFLKAGAARVQVPVRPGFEKAVAFFMQHGIIWEGQDPPLSGDNTYLPIVDEITENLGKIEDGVPYPKGSQPFEVTLPTSLVVLQNLEEIPSIRDMLTGQPITLLAG